MNVFDHLFWIVLVLITVKLIITLNTKLWLLFGLVAGLGLQNKISVLFLLFGIVLGFLLTRQRRLLFNKHAYMGAALAFLLFLPHLIWHYTNGWPTLEFMANASLSKNVHFSALDFYIEQIMNMNPAAFPVWIGGFIFLFTKRLTSFRLFAFAYIAIFTILVIQHGKPYYLYPIYPLLFSCGAVLFEILFRKPWAWLKPVTIIAIVSGGLFALPMALPILPVETFLTWQQKTGMAPTPQENHDMGLLPQHFADMHGWQSLAQSETLWVSKC